MALPPRDHGRAHHRLEARHRRNLGRGISARPHGRGPLPRAVEGAHGAMSEVELKFALESAAAAKLPRTAALARPGRRRRLTSIYFDTQEATLAKHGMALRLRRAGGRWTQCLKAGGEAKAGLHAREEWVQERPGMTLGQGHFG